MRPSKRFGVSKGKSARKFRKGQSRTNATNMVNRGGIRL